MPLIKEPPQQHTYSSMRNQIILIYKTQPTQARKIQNSRHPRRKRTPKQNAAIVGASWGLIKARRVLRDKTPDPRRDIQRPRDSEYSWCVSISSAARFRTVQGRDVVIENCRKWNLSLPTSSWIQSPQQLMIRDPNLQRSSICPFH
jgi:hypothetical protein